jgi:RNA methyltransferase, TrmH family
MLTKSQIQSIRNLHDKTGRREAGLFLVEWRKGIMEFLDSDFDIVEGFFTEELLTLLSSWGTKDLPKEGADSSQARSGKIKKIDTFQFPHSIISERELERITTLSSNRDGLLVVRMRDDSFLCHSDNGGICTDTTEADPSFLRMTKGKKWQKQSNLTLILDGINDPGNLGTIIRTADWYGISHIICSLDTVDCYNSKVLMATMGSFVRVHVEYRDLEEYLCSVISTETKYEWSGEILPENKQSKISRTPRVLPYGALRSAPLEMTETLKNPKIYGAYLDGESTHTKKFTTPGWYLVIGSESHGIRSNLEKYITDKITIPRFGLAESLNAGVATAVILDRMRGS